MTRRRMILEVVAMHVVATAAMLLCLLIAIDVVKAHPSGTHCHRHNAVVHCH